MKSHLSAGWSITKQHFQTIILLFLYQFLWNFFLYRSLSEVIYPVLQRYPKISNQELLIQQFWIEGQFQLLKTDLVTPYLWVLGLLLVLRMIITPLIQAGLYHSIHHARIEGRSAFRKGIAAYWKPFFILYWLKNVLMLAPLCLLLPKLWNILLHGASWNSSLLVQVLLYALWVGVIQYLFFIMQLGVASRHGIWQSCKAAIQNVIPIVTVSLMIALITFLIGTTFHSLSFLWSGFIALVLYQLYPLLSSICKVWMISSQYDALYTKQ